MLTVHDELAIVLTVDNTALIGHKKQGRLNEAG